MGRLSKRHMSVLHYSLVRLREAVDSAKFTVWMTTKLLLLCMWHPKELRKIDWKWHACWLSGSALGDITTALLWLCTVVPNELPPVCRLFCGKNYLDYIFYGERWKLAAEYLFCKNKVFSKSKLMKGYLLTWQLDLSTAVDESLAWPGFSASGGWAAMCNGITTRLSDASNIVIARRGQS